MKIKLLPLLLLFSLLINFGMVYFFIFKGNTVEIKDQRTTVLVSPTNKDFILDEMRVFLESVQQINQGIIEKEPSKIIAAGKASGGSAIDQAQPGLIKSLPLAFKTLGFSTHDIFDEIKDSAKVNFDPQQTQRQLGLLLNKCVACHKTYKLEAKL